MLRDTRDHHNRLPSSDRLRTPSAATAMILAIALSAATPHSRASAAVRAEPHHVRPVVLTDEGALVGCGLAADYRTKGQEMTISVVGLRDQTATRFMIEARPSKSGQGAAKPASLVLRTGTLDSSSLFPPPSETAGQSLVTSARLEPVTGARFIQSVMVAGADVDVALASGDALALALPGPMPQLVRASYLNCAGDLFRPEGEGRRPPAMPGE